MPCSYYQCYHLSYTRYCFFLGAVDIIRTNRKLVKRFTKRLFYKRTKNTLFAHGYPGNLIYKVITRVRSLTTLKINDPLKCPVYLKLPFFVVLSLIKTLRKFLWFSSIKNCTKHLPLAKWNQNRCFSIKKKSTSCIITSCPCGIGYVETTTQKFHLRIEQYVLKIFRN